MFDGAFGELFSCSLWTLFEYLDDSDYGNEKEAGVGVKRAIDEGIVKREDLVIVSKLWNTFHEKERVEPITREQLKWWGIEYVAKLCPSSLTSLTIIISSYFDIFYIHFPVALEYVDPKDKYPSGWHTLDGKVRQSKASIQETWQAMEHLVDIGLVKSIGVSNFQGSLLIDLLRYARIRPALLQVEIHPYLVQEELVQFAQSEGIVITAYSSCVLIFTLRLFSLAECHCRISFGPQSFVELDWDKAIQCLKLFEHPAITEIASKHHKTPAQVLLRWATQRGLAIIPKANNPVRALENLDSISFDLQPEEVQVISNLNKNIRFNNPPDVSFHQT